MNLKFACPLITLLCFIGWFSGTTTRAQKSEDPRILLQGFYWDCYQGQEGEWYNIISRKADEMAAAGIDMIWLPAPSAASGGMGYLPTELYDLSNNFGSESEHRALLSQLTSVGIEPIADIVINHRNGSTNWLDFQNPAWDGTRSIVANDEVWFQAGYGHLPRGGNDTGEGYEAGRDIDHTNNIVRQGIKEWLNYLKQAGYKGWRYDLVKGYSPHYTEEYNNASNPTFSVGEFYDFDKQKVQAWVDGTNKQSTAFDFPTYATIKNAIKDNNYSYLAYEGAASGLIGWSPGQSTTFIENHDTPRYDSDRNIFHSGNVCIGYAYILTHPGTPTIYWPHYFDWGVKEKIDDLITVRKEMGITNTSQLNILKAEPNCYAAIINSNVAVKIGSGNWSPEGEFRLKASGNNYAVWARDDKKQKPEVALTKGGNFPSGSVSIKMKATNSGIIYYTLDGSTPSEASMVYEGEFEINSKTIIHAIAYNSEGASSIVSQSYSFDPQPLLTVLWKTEAGSPHLWFWDVINEGNNPAVPWPGAKMTASMENPGWYEYTIEGSGASFIFCDGGEKKTGDLINITDSDNQPTDGKIWYDNGWVDGNGGTMVNSPVIAPNGGDFEKSITIALTADPGAKIYYTTDDTPPTAKGKLFSSNIVLNKTTCIKAIAIKNGMPSKVVSATFSKKGQVIAAPVITPNGGSFEKEISVSLSAEKGALIYYTTDGTMPSTSNKQYSSPIKIDTTTTLKAIAVKDEITSKFTSAFFKKNGGGSTATDFFTWDNANVYFVMTDRFYNGDTNNDQSYGRGKDGNGKEYPDDNNSGAGEFHGGDLKGMTAKLRAGYFDEIGVNAIWITSPVEQMHGWCGGGPKGNFRHYGYHGYYALDWSELDDNIGTEADLMEFVDEAHSRGIRIVMDIVLNHTGYATMHEMEAFNYGSVDPAWRSWMPSIDQTWHSYHDHLVNYEKGDWTTNYWGTDWIRHPDIKGYESGGGDLTRCVGFLPDLKTESTDIVDIPGILRAKWSAEGVLKEKQSELDTFFAETMLSRTVSNYMIFWIVDWVRKYGIDGFRIDTAKHVDKDVLKRLKDMAIRALKDWKAEHPDKALNDDEFWTTGEVWGHGFAKSPYHTEAGFNSVINFNLQSNSLNRDNLEATFSEYAKVNEDRSWNGLSYLSSHDTKLYDRTRLREVAPGFLLLPGGIQTFYGDESGRPLGTYDDKEQNTRSDMNWGSFDQATFNVWKKLGTFRREHPSIGAGSHRKLSDSPYIFAREYIDPETGFEDNVLVAINASGSTTFDVSGIFPNGHKIEDHFTGTIQTVENGKVAFTPDNEGIILLWDKDFVNVNKPMVNFVTETLWSEDSLEVVLNISDKEDDKPVLYYTFEDSLTTENLTAWHTYSDPFVIRSTQTIRIVGINKDGHLSRVYSKEYLIGPIEPITLWFYKPEEWAGAYLYFDGLTPECEEVSTTIDWPGAEMVPEGNGWYSYSLKALSAEVLVFNGGSNREQTADLSRSGDGWYKDGNWHNSCPGSCPEPQVPKVSIAINETGSTGEFEVAISATADGVIYYTTDGTNPNQLDSLYSTSFIVTEGSTVKAIAYNSTGMSQVVEKRALPKETLTFMWKTPMIKNPTIHIWNVDNKPGNLTSWPGAKMTPSSTYPGWVRYAIEGKSANVIFVNSDGKTDDLLNISDSDGLEDGTVWYNRGWVPKPEVNNDSLTIHYKGDYTHIYYWSEDQQPTFNWPGDVMTQKEEDGWYVYTIPHTTCSNIIFDNTVTQTDNLYRCEEGWYTDGKWYDLKPTLKSKGSGKSSQLVSEICLYPNPANDYLYIKNTPIGSKVTIYSALGKIVYNGTSGNDRINICKLNAGLYIVRVGAKSQILHVQ